MAQASAIVLDGFQLRSDAKIVRWPDRYMDERGWEFWDQAHRLPNEIVAGSGSHFRGLDSLGNRGNKTVEFGALFSGAANF